MDKFEKALFILFCYAEALILNLFVIGILEGLNLLVWIIYNIWIWCFVPLLILKAREEK